MVRIPCQKDQIVIVGHSNMIIHSRLILVILVESYAYEYDHAIDSSLNFDHTKRENNFYLLFFIVDFAFHLLFGFVSFAFLVLSSTLSRNIYKSF